MTKWKVGITGGIGSGKTHCARIFQQLSIPVYNSDERAQRLMNLDATVRKNLIDLLGNQTFQPDGTLNKEFLREKVFGDPLWRQEINKIVHPAVEVDYDHWHSEQDSPYTLKEAALLVESGSYLQLDCLIMVEAPVSIRMLRILSRDRISPEAAQNRMNSQMADSLKKEFSHEFIDNSGCYSLFPQILELHKRLIGYDPSKQ